MCGRAVTEGILTHEVGRAAVGRKSIQTPSVVGAPSYVMVSFWLAIHFSFKIGKCQGGL